MVSIGCDQHKHYCLMSTIDKNSKVVNQEKIYHHSDRAALKKYLSGLGEDTHIAIEACGYDAWIVDLMESYGINVHLAHPLKTKAIAEAKVKTDKIDATVLAQLLQANLLPEAYFAPAEVRDRRALLRYRQSLVHMRTQTKNRIHYIIDRLGIIPPQVQDLFGVTGMKWIKTLELAGNYQKILNGHLMLLETLVGEIKQVDRDIRIQLSHTPQADLLQTIPGVGAFTSFLLLAEIGPIERFSHHEKLCSYAGLTPCVHQSGKVHYHGHITKQGNKFIRWAMVEAAHVAINKDPGLNQFYHRLKYKKGTSKALVAVARKLLTAVYHVLSKNEEYRFHKFDPRETRQHPALCRA